MVSERTDGAGDENVLPSCLDSCAPPIVRAVPVTDEAPCDGAFIDLEASWSVSTVSATDLAPAVGGFPPSSDSRADGLSSDVSLPVEAELSYGLPGRAGCPDCGYGLFFFPALRFPCMRSFEWDCQVPSPEDLKLVSFLTHVANGRRFPDRSGCGSA